MSIADAVIVVAAAVSTVVLTVSVTWGSRRDRYADGKVAAARRALVLLEQGDVSIAASRRGET